MDDDFQVSSISKYDSVEIARYIKTLASTCQSHNSDPFTQVACKHDLFLLKCLIQDLYEDLPEFPSQEKEWEQNRLMELLRK